MDYRLDSHLQQLSQKFYIGLRLVLSGKDEDQVWWWKVDLFMSSENCPEKLK